jgi:hypothetical protein
MRLLTNRNNPYTLIWVFNAITVLPIKLDNLR